MTMTINDALGRKRNQQPQFDYLWQLQMPSLDAYPTGGIPAAGTYVNDVFEMPFSQKRSFDTPNIKSPNRDIGMAIAEEISHRVYGVTTPYRNYTTRQSISSTAYRYAADKSDIGSLVLVVDEFEDGLTLRYFSEWMGLMYNHHGNGGKSGLSRNPPFFYKRNIKFAHVTKMQNEAMMSEYIGYFPTEITPTQYSYDGTSVLQYTVTLSGDDVKHTFVAKDEEEENLGRGDILTNDQRSHRPNPIWDDWG